ncbi:hypothetical protein EDC01DRAFT_779984 [Geopyxis carbonaria]|nr:hypothetical protein EDC01DRAFT_779984 [Geopyxis carbonaria]
MSSIADNRFARYTSTDHSAPVWIATLLSLIFSFLILTVRLAWVKWKRHGLDDLILVMAHLIAVAHWGTLFSALSSGLAKSPLRLPASNRTSISTLVFTSRLLLFLTLALTKASVFSFIRTLFTGNSTVSRLTHVAIAAVLTLGAASATAISLAPSHETLTTLMVLDVLSEIALLALPIAFLWPIQMPRPKKLLVVFAFGLRLPLTVVAAGAYIYFGRTWHGDPAGDAGPSIMAAVVVQNCVIGTALISATIPCLRGFVGAFTTGGMGYTNAAEPGISAGTGGGTGGSYQLQSLQRDRRKGSAAPVKRDDESEDEAEAATVGHMAAAAETGSVAESQRVMIRRRREEGELDGDESDSV